MGWPAAGVLNMILVRGSVYQAPRQLGHFACGIREYNIILDFEMSQLGASNPTEAHSQHVEHSSHPESQDVGAPPRPEQTLESILNAVTQERDQIKVCFPVGIMDM